MDTNTLDDADTIARVLKALSVPTRVRIIRLLQGRMLCVNALAARLNVTQGAISQHLRVLRDAGLVEPDRHGYFVHYRVSPRAAGHCRAAVEFVFGSQKGGKRCVAEKRNAKGRKT